jgi:hypothetical protein
MKARADRVLFTDAPTVGAVAHEFKVGVEPCVVMRLWTDCGAAINFNQLMRTSAFSAVAARQKLVDRLNAISGVAIVRPDTLEWQPLLRLASLAADEGAGFLKIMDWMVDKLREAPATAA